MEGKVNTLHKRPTAGQYDYNKPIRGDKSTGCQSRKATPDNKRDPQKMTKFSTNKTQAR